MLSRKTLNFIQNTRYAEFTLLKTMCLREQWLLSRPYLEATETSPAQKCMRHKKFFAEKQKRIKRKFEMEGPTIMSIKKKLTSINNF
jgi:hypothetical protein